MRFLEKPTARPPRDADDDRRGEALLGRRSARASSPPIRRTSARRARKACRSSARGASSRWPRKTIAVDAFEIPRHWAQIGGLDFGWDHPTAAVRLAWDRDADCLYVTNAYRQREATPVVHAAALRAWGDVAPLGLAA